MKFSPRSEAHKINCLINYHKIYKDRGVWTQTLNHRLPYIIPASKDCVVGIYKAVISLHERKTRKSARSPLPTIDELCLRKYGSEKQTLKRTTLNKYLKYMVEGMMQIIALDYLKENDTLGLPSYLGGLKNGEPKFHLQEMVRNHSYRTSYSILKDTYFHPLYNKRTSSATQLMKTIIEEFKISSYTETIILVLQSMEIALAKNSRLPSFPSLPLILEDAKSNNFWNDTRLKIYVSFITALNDRTKQINKIVAFSEQFSKIVRQTNDKGNHLLPDYDTSYIYNLLSNTLIRHQRNGSQECHRAAVRLNDACIRTAAVIIDGHIPHEYFFNIIYQRIEVGLSHKLYSLNDILIFIDKHIESVHENKRETSDTLTRKYTYLRYGEAEKAYQIGIGKSYSIVDEMLFACFELACLFSLNLKDDEFTIHCKSFQILLEKGRSDNNKVQIDGYVAFVRQLQKLRILDEKTEKLHELDKMDMLPSYQSKHDEIKMNPNYISMKPWLLDIYAKRIREKDVP